MPIVKQNATPSTLVDLIVQVKQAFDLMGDATPILIGKHHLQRGAGSAPRVVFVPESGNGKVDAPRIMGHSASMVHTCEVRIRARESGEDLDRFKEAYALADLVIDCISTAAPGRLEWGPLFDGSPTDSDAYGAELVFSFTYRRDILHNAKRWALPPADTDNSDRQPSPPPGTPADVQVNPTTVPENPS